MQTPWGSTEPTDLSDSFHGKRREVKAESQPDRALRYGDSEPMQGHPITYEGPLGPVEMLGTEIYSNYGTWTGASSR